AHRGIVEERRAGRRAETPAEEEIAVAVHQVELHAAAAQVPEQAGDHGVERQAEVVVADPVLEEVAEDVQRARGARLAFQKLDEALVRLRPLLGEVQVGDEQGGHYGAFTYFWVTSVIDSITIGW